MTRIKAIYYGSNGWLLEFDKIRILVDPWLKGDLIFPPGAWFFKGRLSNKWPIPKNIDLILLTQGLSDHCHSATLDEFSKNIPVYGSKSCSKVVKKLGFKSFKKLSPGNEIYVFGLRILVTSGAPVPQTENGYIISYKHFNLYIEPHGYVDKNIEIENIHTIITPIVDVSLPIIGNIIRGREAALQLAKKFNPINILASATGGDAIYSGIVNEIIQIKGTLNDLENNLTKHINCIDPLPGKEYLLVDQKDIDHPNS